MTDGLTFGWNDGNHGLQLWSINIELFGHASSASRYRHSHRGSLTWQDIDVENDIDDVPIVNKYKDIFPEAYRSYHPTNNKSFTINHKSSSALVSKAPYRMTPKELQNLIVQRQELISLDSIRPNGSHVEQ